MNFPSWGETMAKLGISFALAALIGWERERVRRGPPGCAPTSSSASALVWP